MMKSSKKILRNLKLALCIPSLLLSLSVNADVPVNTNNVRILCHENAVVTEIYSGYVPYSTQPYLDDGQKLAAIKYGEINWGMEVRLENGDLRRYVVAQNLARPTGESIFYYIQANDNLYKTVLYAYTTGNKISISRRNSDLQRCASAGDVTGAFVAITLEK